jgi:hemolysin activation/secretion protein
LIAAMAATMAPLPLRAQECAPDEPECAAGGPCPLKNLPYEEFVVSPPASRGRYDVPPVSERPFDPDSGDKILVRGFVVENVTSNPDAGVTPEAVQAAANAAFKRLAGAADELLMTVGQMQRVSDAVTTFYRNSGYLVSKAFIPVQTLGDNAVVRISVLEGRVSEIAVENASDYSADILRRPSAALVGATPTRDSVESALLYTQDYPGLRLFGSFRPGAQVGETQLVLQIQNEDRFGFSAGADNFGTELTGLYRLRGDAAWNNPAGWGDQLNLSVLQSVAPENTTYGSLGYRVPLGVRGLSGLINTSYNAFVVDEPPFDVLQLEGTISTYEAGADWRFKRFRLFNARAGLLFASKQSELTATGTTTVTDDNFNVVTVDAGMDRTDTRFRGVDNLSFKIRQGAGGEFSSGGSFATDFTIYDLNYLRLQALTETQYAILRVNVQFTGEAISPIEQFTMAGPDKVRAYPVGQALRDTGEFVSLEYQVEAPGFASRQGPLNRQWRDLLKFSLFADYAHGKSANVEDGDVLSGAGLGIIFGVPGSFQFHLQGASPLSSVDASDGNDTRFYGSLSVKF